MSRTRTRAAASRPRSPIWIAVFVAALLAILAAVAIGTLERAVPPRTLALHLERRAAGHGPLVMRAGQSLAALLMRLDRGEVGARPRPALRIGAQAEVAQSAAVSGRLVSVSSPEEVVHAIEQARPGDVITLAPGRYAFAAAIEARRAGTPEAPIIVRAARPGSVVVDVNAIEGFLVTAPYWTFENLTVRGVCAMQGACEHAFHVVGAATHFVARNNTLLDFNAHVKVNGSRQHFPDHGRLEANTLRNGAPRDTDGPVAPIGIVAASHWVILGNVISDFVKARGDQISSGAYAKGGGSDNRFERNVVLCEDGLRGRPGWRVGISLGDGGSAREFCRDRACVVEHGEGTIAANLVAFCSDDGIYLNRSASSRIAHNTLVDTGGILVRFAESSADVEGNLVDGAIRSRDGALLHAADNLSTSMLSLYLGRHPERELFFDAAALDLRWRAGAPRVRAAGPRPVDLCRAERPAVPAFGAFEEFVACVGTREDAALIRSTAPER